MTYSGGLKSPREESSIPTYSSSSRPRATPMASHHLPSATTERANLPRRFTTNALPTVANLSSLSSPLSPIGQQRRQAAEQPDFANTNLHKVQQLQKKIEEYEYLRQQRRIFQSEMDKIEMQAKNSEHEMQRLEKEVQRLSLTGHPQSEPTTPPEYRDAGFPTAISRPNRLSLVSLTSPSKANNNNTTSVTSTSAFVSTTASSHRNTLSASHSIGSPFSSVPYSVPGSRRNSDEEEEDSYDLDLPTFTRRSAVRNSMPVSNLDFTQLTGYPNVDSVLSNMSNINSLLSESTEENAPRMSTPSHRHTASMDGNHDLRLEQTHDGFPMLVGQSRGNTAATSSPSDRTAAPNDGSNISNGSWIGISRHRANQKSLPMNSMQGRRDEQEPVPPRPDTSRRSSQQGPPQQNQPVYGGSSSQIPSSFANGIFGSTTAGSGSSIPPSQPYGVYYGQSVGSPTPQSTPSHVSIGHPVPAISGYNGMTSTGGPATMAPMPMVPPGPWQPMSHGYGPTHPPYQHPNGYFPYSSPQPQIAPGTVRSSRHERRPDDGTGRYNSSTVQDHRGELLDLCRDQHGCRFLQKKLEERTPEDLNAIFDETHEHFVQLMSDPFGNYMCQKLVEYCTNDQRTVLVGHAAPKMLDIGTNQHGTRALQKMIEFLSTPEQVQIVIEALRDQVVTLIQDLNGNHVIQKCLNHLKPEDAQFIFDAVGSEALTVGTHRHGCCVMQRCIDHATGNQKSALIAQICENALPLIQDPFGNYVIQYILDLKQPEYTRPLCISFRGFVSQYAMQKFSSNVIEKCFRVADDEMKRLMAEELIGNIPPLPHGAPIVPPPPPPVGMEALLKDMYANYVVQTALSTTDSKTKDRLWGAVVPVLNTSFRNGPSGRRILTKYQAYRSELGKAGGGSGGGGMGGVGGMGGGSGQLRHSNMPPPSGPSLGGPLPAEFTPAPNTYHHHPHPAVGNGPHHISNGGRPHPPPPPPRTGHNGFFGGGGQHTGAGAMVGTNAPSHFMSADAVQNGGWI